MPSRLRPTAPIAADAVLVGDPGRALLLAQELLEEPKMSNHARGLWGYFGQTPAGGELTIQATGMGGPSAAIVLADLAELGVRRAVRVGTCTGAGPSRAPGELLLVAEAVADGGSAASFGVAPGDTVAPDPGAARRLARARRARPPARSQASTLPADAGSAAPGPRAADMQTVARAGPRELGNRRGGGPDRHRGRAAEQLDERSSESERNGPEALPRPYSQPRVEG